MSYNRIINGDCLELIKSIESNSIDAVITDPPYELGNFRGEVQKWESSGAAYSYIWKECNRVLKDGGYLLSFGANRTIHKIASKIEEAGFEIREMVIWKYKQSIPRNMNISKAIDAIMLYGKSSSKYLRMVEQEYGGEEYQIKGTNNTMFGSKVTYIRKEYSPITEAAKSWDGWGTALAPSYEPIIVARKKLGEENLAKNLLKHGVGALNIDALKIEYGKFPSNVIEIEKEKKDEFNNHPTVKPIKLMEYLVKLVTKEDYLILDPFAGSCTTALACKNTNRKYICFEIKEEYCAIGEKRLNNNGEIELDIKSKYI